MLEIPHPQRIGLILQKYKNTRHLHIILPPPPPPFTQMPEETNILTDGCLIDLCGLTLMWRTAIGLEQGVSQTIMREHRKALNEMSPQCPVNLHTLHFRGNSAASTSTTISTVSPGQGCCINYHIAGNFSREKTFVDCYTHLHNWFGTLKRENFHK